MERVPPDEDVVRSSSQRNPSFLFRKSKSRLFNSDDESQSSRSPSSVSDPFLVEDFPQDFKSLIRGAFWKIQSVSLILILIGLVCCFTVPSLKNIALLKLSLWKWLLLLSTLVSGRLIAGIGVRILVFFMEKNFMLRKRVLYFVYGLRYSVQHCLWFSLIFVVWQILFHSNIGTLNAQIVTKFLICLLLGSVIWFIKTLLVKVLASLFHVNVFFDRIQALLFTQYVHEKLAGSPLTHSDTQIEDSVALRVQDSASAAEHSGRYLGGRTQKPKTEEDSEITMMNHLQSLNRSSVSSWDMNRLINKVTKNFIRNLDERVQGVVEINESMGEIITQRRANAAAWRIFRSVAQPGYTYIVLNDLMRFLSEDEALKVMQIFEVPSEEEMRISSRQFVDWVVNAYRDRKALTLSLKDTKTAVNRLHMVINVLTGILLFALWLLILGVATTKFFMFLASQILLAAFVFGDASKRAFESIIFIFVDHPFDVGDCVEIDGVEMVVEEMNLLTTVFLRQDNRKIYYPNIILSTKIITNYSRSPDMKESIDFLIPILTPEYKISEMRDRIIKFVAGNKDFWCPESQFLIKNIENTNELRWSLAVTNKMSNLDICERWKRRNLLVEMMIRIFKDLDIKYSLVPCDLDGKKYS